MTLGEKIKKLRSDRRISLNEVSRVTKIQVKYLEYLEDGCYEKMPADVYVKGFLRSYAEFLGVEDQVLIRLYEKEKGIKNNLEKVRHPIEVKKDPVNISSFVFTPKKIVVSLAAIVVLGGFFYLYNEVGSFANSPRLVILNPQSGSDVSGNAVSIEGVTDKDSEVFINGQPILVNDDGKFRENVTLQSGVNAISVKSINKFEKESVETITVNSDYKPKEESNPSEQENSNMEVPEQNELQVEIRVDPGPVWLSIEADDNLVFSGTMLTGAVQIFKAQNKIVINSGRANATFVKFNGKDIGALSQDAGAVRGVTFTTDTKF